MEWSAIEQMDLFIDAPGMNTQHVLEQQDAEV